MTTAKAVDPIYHMGEAELYSGEHRKTLKRRAKEGKLEIIELNARRHGIRKSVLDRYMATKTVVKGPCDAPAK